MIAIYFIANDVREIFRKIIHNYAEYSGKNPPIIMVVQCVESKISSVNKQKHINNPPKL